mgnify:CR=1 FL=1
MNVLEILRALHRYGMGHINIKNIYEFKNGKVAVHYGDFPQERVMLKKVYVDHGCAVMTSHYVKQ